MNKKVKLLNLILVVILAFCCVFCFSACSDDDDQAKFKIYFTNDSHDDITSMTIDRNESTGTDLRSNVSQLLSLMFESDFSSEQMFSAKPDNVRISSINIDDGILTIDFSDEYLDMTNVEEIILRATTVLTVIQLDGIDGVDFTVSGKPICYSDGSEIGIMTADDFVSILLTETGMLKQETDVTIYFTNKSGTSLVPITSHFVTSNNNTSMEEYVVNEIIKGPAEDSDVYPTIDSNVELISVASSENICYVNFGDSFLEQDAQPVSDDIMVYSIVNSLCRLTYIDRVQFLINGEPVDKLHTVMDISSPLTRNILLEY